VEITEGRDAVESVAWSAGEVGTAHPGALALDEAPRWHRIEPDGRDRDTADPLCSAEVLAGGEPSRP
jgi:hypothetical protein